MSIKYVLFSAELKPRGYYLELVFYLDHVIFSNMSHVYYLDQNIFSSRPLAVLRTFSFLVIFRLQNFYSFQDFQSFQNFQNSFQSVKNVQSLQNFQNFFLRFIYFCSSSLQFYFWPKSTWMRLVVCKTWFYLFS